MTSLSITPAHRIFNSILPRRFGGALCAALVVGLLSGCATTGQQSADTSLRDAYQAQATSDPLGAYLAQNDYGLSRGSNLGYD